MFTLKLNDDTELRPIEPRYAEELFSLVDRNREHLRKWLPFVDGTKTSADTLAFIKNSLRDHAEKGDQICCIWHKNKLTGNIGLHMRNQSGRCAEIGYWLGKEFEGKGLVTMACRAIIDYAFRELGCNRIQIRVEPANTRSRAIPVRLGFTYEGTLRQVDWCYDRPVDHEMHSLLREEWEKQSALIGKGM